MPLTQPQDRELLHSRDIVLRGYRRADELYDIEAQLTDTKTYGSASHDRGYIQAGEPIHGMWLRLTVDEERRIVACEAASDYTPYTICPAAAPNFARLAGLQIRPGFLREAAKRVGGTIGCTHLRELLQQLATTAYQTIASTIGAANEGELGTILVNPKGRTLYLFRGDSGTKSTCFGACAAAWPPLQAAGKPTVGGGADAALLGTTTRSDGEQQVTYNGHPLYRYYGDENPGDTNGQGLNTFGGLWYALSTAGDQVSGTAPSSGGGYGY